MIIIINKCKSDFSIFDSFLKFCSQFFRFGPNGSIDFPLEYFFFFRFTASITITIRAKRTQTTLFDYLEANNFVFQIFSYTWTPANELMSSNFLLRCFQLIRIYFRTGQHTIILFNFIQFFFLCSDFVIIFCIWKFLNLQNKKKNKKKSLVISFFSVCLFSRLVESQSIRCVNSLQNAWTSDMYMYKIKYNIMNFVFTFVSFFVLWTNEIFGLRNKQNNRRPTILVRDLGLSRVQIRTQTSI